MRVAFPTGLALAMTVVPWHGLLAQHLVAPLPPAIAELDTARARPLRLTLAASEADTTVGRRGDHRYIGAAIGAVLFGTLAVLASEGLCDEDTCTGRSIGAGLGWGAAGAILGALVGAAVPRGGSKPNERGSP